eukprot:Skav203432  [mRNA]  locus=scaffold727:102299:103840:+ [translate_table: standard]
MKAPTPISLFRSEESELDPACNDFPSLHILEVVHNNLGGVGPDSGSEGLFYHVRSSQGKDFEMRVHAEDFNCPFPDRNGMKGEFATVNVASESDVSLHFRFHDWHTKAPVTMDDFALTFVDLDHGPGNAGVEELVIRGDWTQAVVAEDTNLLVQTPEESDQIAFRATDEAAKPDEPKTPNTLTLGQFNKAVTVKFSYAKAFTATVKVLTRSYYPRFFEFVGQGSILCAHDPAGGKLPVGEVYINKEQLKKTQNFQGQEHSEISQGFGLQSMLFGLGLVLVASACCYFYFTSNPSNGYAAMAFQEDKQGPGLFSVAIPVGKAKLGLLLDAPDGINQPPMVKEILTGAVKDFNELNPTYAIEPYDAIISCGEASGAQEVVQALASLSSEQPDEVTLQCDRPERFQISVTGALGVQLDAFEDSLGAVIIHIEPDGALAKWNSRNSHRAVNPGDRIIELGGADFSARKGWTMRGDAKVNPFASRSNSRFLEELDAQSSAASELNVTVLKYASSESKA